MSDINIQIAEGKGRVLRRIASVKGKTITEVIEELIDDYINENQQRFLEKLEKEQLSEVTKMSEEVFGEWDNEEDEIYNQL